MTHNRNPSVSTGSTCICYHKLITLATLLRLNGGADTPFLATQLKLMIVVRGFFLGANPSFCSRSQNYFGALYIILERSLCYRGCNESKSEQSRMGPREDSVFRTKGHSREDRNAEGASRLGITTYSRRGCR